MYLRGMPETLLGGIFLARAEASSDWLRGGEARAFSLGAARKAFVYRPHRSHDAVREWAP